MILEVESLEVRYGDVIAVRKVDLAVEQHRVEDPTGVVSAAAGHTAPARTHSTSRSISAFAIFARPRGIFGKPSAWLIALNPRSRTARRARSCPARRRRRRSGRPKNSRTRRRKPRTTCGSTRTAWRRRRRPGGRRPSPWSPRRTIALIRHSIRSPVLRSTRLRSAMSARASKISFEAESLLMVAALSAALQHPENVPSALGIVRQARTLAPGGRQAQRRCGGRAPPVNGLRSGRWRNMMRPLVRS